MKKPRLLIVDDAINLTLYYQQELEDEGYHVDIANSTHRAAELLASEKYALVIVEPMIIEIEKLEEFRQKMSSRNKTPVIINTGNPEFECRQNVLSVEVCIIKSSDITSLKESIEVLLGPYGKSKAPFELIAKKINMQEMDADVMYVM